MSRFQLHEMPKIIKTYYCKVHETVLGNPITLFSRFDERIRAHPTIQPVFSLARGIESWPDTIVEPVTVEDKTLPALQRAIKNLRMLSIQEQNLNMATLNAYKSALQFIIDNQTWLKDKDKCLLDWFEERASYDPMDIETPIRKSPRGKKRKKR